MIWFSSDQHFGHGNIIKYCDRPFETREEMDEAMIENWNKLVRKGDQVYVLGDFSFYEPDMTNQILDRLVGQKFLVKGNHDSKKRLKKTVGWEWVKDYHEAKIAGARMVLFHFPIHQWRGKGTGSLHLHGHSHGNTNNEGLRRYDVGVDLHEFKPVLAEEVILKLRDVAYIKEERDH